MGYALKPSLSYCWIGTVPFFLDAEADRYFRLSDKAAGAFAAFSGGGPLSPADIAALSASGVLRSLDGPTQLPVPALVPLAVDALAAGDSKPSVALLALALLDYLCAALALRFGTFFRLSRQLTDKMRKQDKPLDRAVLAAVVKAYRILDLLISPNGRCLPRSLAMGRTLLRYGGNFSIILGVRNGPFGAHCWLQQGPLVLNDRIDNVRDFVPILAL